MTTPASGAVPPGWYPDPAGARQWRVWTGRDWSSVTRAYDAEHPAAPLAASLGLVSALHRLLRYGVVAVLAGVGLVVSVADHWPGTAHPIGPTVAATLLSSALALLTLGSVAYGAAAREIAGRWSWSFVVPGLNVVVVSVMVSHLLGERGPWRRAGANVVLLVLFALESRHYPYLAALPALVSLDLMTSLSRLTRRVLDAPPAAAGAS